MLEKSLSSMIRQLTKDFSSSSYLTLILMIWSNKSKEVFSIVPKPDIPALLTLKWIIAINTGKSSTSKFVKENSTMQKPAVKT